eukprot:6718110-Pyramimonas_sp.AAC.1
MVNVSEHVCWHDVAVSGRNSSVDSWCLRSQEWCSGKIQDRQDATVTVSRGVEVPGTVDLAQFRIVKRPFSDRAPPAEKGAWKEGLSPFR